MTKRRMLAAVPKADLVVMNPTHYAVALKYEDGKMAAPRVVAKGADLLALKIRDIAKDAKGAGAAAAGLARSTPTPSWTRRSRPRSFAAVAQVLAYVYQLRAALRARRRCRWSRTARAAQSGPHNDPGLEAGRRR